MDVNIGARIRIVHSYGTEYGTVTGIRRNGVMARPDFGSGEFLVRDGEYTLA